MRRTTGLAAFSMALVVAAAVAIRAGAEQDFYLVPDYDPGRDKQGLITRALDRAAAEDKSVLLVLGGDWCGWCKVLEDDIDRSEELTGLLQQHYIVAKVYCDAGSPGIRYKPRQQPAAGAFYMNIRAKAYPHLVILDSDGNRLHSKSMGGMLKKGRYSESRLRRLFSRHKPG